MRPRLRVLILLVASVVLLGGAFGYAQSGTKQKAPKTPNISESTESPEPTESPDVENDKGKTEAPDASDGTRKQNHGFYVSQAAHCQNVDDPSTAKSPYFTAPSDCKGKAHGDYVSSVAHSSLGKSNKGHGH